MSHKTTNNTMSHSDGKITKNTKEKLNICRNHLFRLKEREKQDADG